MSHGKILEFILYPQGAQPAAAGTFDVLHARALRLLGELQELVQELGEATGPADIAGSGGVAGPGGVAGSDGFASQEQERLSHLAWRATKLADVLCFLASDAGTEQRQRLARDREPDADDHPSRPPAATPPTGTGGRLSDVA
ncbi:hypothetical protein ACNTMW_13195 [Planosporangium sp. 12N6]|uniref:hypothetical protein n=1 Tax=Planosporangium spinosum TaxID=3402278 RepID=UPI003CE85352